MPNLNFEQVEASLKAARRKSKRRFFIFITAILAIWGATYLYTKGEFYFFTKKIAIRDTIVIDQTAAMNARDQIIADQSKLIILLQDSLQKTAALIPRTAVRSDPAKRNEVLLLSEQIRVRELERKRRDSILISRRQEYLKQYPLELEQSTIKNVQVDPKR
jgi:hypothetical protein